MTEPHEIFDNKNMQFKKEDRRKHRELIAFLKSGGYAATLTSPVSRGRFLYNLREFTKYSPVEHLIVGFGINVGRGTVIQHVRHIVGEKNRVKIPQRLTNDIYEWIRDNDVPGIVSYHNHPPGGYDSVVRRPFASFRDREVALRNNYKQQLAAAALNILFSGKTINQVRRKFSVKRIHHYVAYKTQVREYRHFAQGLFYLLLKSSE